jgi:hypothetical protein
MKLYGKIVRSSALASGRIKEFPRVEKTISRVENEVMDSEISKVSKTERLRVEEMEIDSEIL